MFKYILMIILWSTGALAATDGISGARESVGTTLNDAVREIKQGMSETKSDLDAIELRNQGITKDVEELEDKASGEERNPTVLDHAKKAIPKCDYNTKNLVWDGSSWKCVKMTVSTECQAPAPDEYMYKDSNGNNVCAKSPKGASISYYFQFRTYTTKCLGASQGYEKLYDCKYTNKLGQQVEVADSYCSGKSKPAVAKKACKKNWTVGNWGSCNKSCGGGTKTRSVYCESGYDCSSYAKPTNTASCNTQLCKANWVTGSWSKCSQTACGKYGTQTRSVHCPANKTCSHNPKPKTSQSCYTRNCPSWTVGGWGSCNKSCGGGYQYRSVTCKDTSCVGTKPSASQRCNTQLCTTYWRTGSWGSCSKSCGSGTQSRSVYCPSNYRCTGTKPSASQACNTQKCSTTWRTGSWGSCSKSCGGGTKSRSVYCPSGYVCPGSKPGATTSCNTQKCTTYWRTGSWGSCSKSCGGGTKSRSVYCPSGFRCTGTKPGATTSCNTQKCTTYWRTGSWGSCNKTCGGGYKYRSVTCPSGYACTGTKPATSTRCNTQSCVTYSWYTGLWIKPTSCSYTKYKRDVYCRSSTGSKVSDSKCSGSKPSNWKPYPNWKEDLCNGGR
jgi:hypothetical protein